MKIAILDAHNKDFNSVADFTRPRKTIYCDRHGYDLIYYHFEDVGRFPTWGKVKGVQEYLPRYDFICFLDTDILIMNFSVKIEDQIDNKHNIFIGFMPDFNTGEMTHLSTSAWIIKNNAWSLEFLEKWWNTTDYLNERYPPNNEYTPATRGFGGKYHEQTAFSYLYDIDEDCRTNTKIMPFSWFNQREVNYKKGDFLVHFARQKEKLERMKRFLNQNQALL